MRLLLSFIFIVATVAGQAQDYVVTTQNDTLYGKVEIMLPDTFYEELSITIDGDKKRFKSFQILEASSDSAIYRPAKIQDKFRLLKLVQDGYLGLYLYRAEDSYDFNTSYLLKSTTEGMIVPNISFRKRVADFLSECPSVVTKIEDKSYKKSDLAQIVIDYNLCLETQTQDKYDEPALEASDANQTTFALIENIKQKAGLTEKDELAILLNDIKQKIKSGADIPGYLIAALKDQTNSKENIATEVAALLQALEQ